jgi:tetrahydromethanopterin S-methyltransferase subunit G
MAVTEERITHLAGCLDRTIGAEARSTMLDMLTAADVSNLATKSDIVVLDVKLDEVEKRIDIKLDEAEQRTSIRLDELEKRMDIKLDEAEQRISIRLDELEKRMDIKLESLEHRITAATMKAINRHLTFSVTAMSAITGIITVAAR